MSTEREIANRLRSARPRAQSSPPPFEAVAALIDTAMEDSPPTARKLWSRRLGLLLALGALTIGAGAWGATQLLSGSPVRPPFAWVKAKPTVGLGVPLRSSLQALGLRTADPSGGLPWGLRIIRTTRGQACIQAGRVLDGQLGAVGMGYAFHGDGRFHPFAPATAFGEHCLQSDAHGRVYLAQGAITASADGLSLAENTFERVHCDLPDQHNWGVRCPRSRLRLLAFGALGPDAVDLRVNFNKHSFHIKPYGSAGAYLLVFPVPAGTNVGGYFGAQPPVLPMLTVLFRNGTSCRVPEAGDTSKCLPQGFDFPAFPKFTNRQLSIPIRVVYSKHVTGGEPAIVTTGRHSAQTEPIAGPTPALLITFKVPIGTPGSLSAYAAELQRPVLPGCFGGSRLLSQEPTHTLLRGQVTHIIIPLQAACHGLYSGRVFYIAVRPGLEGGTEERLENRLSMRLLELPRNPANGEQEVTIGHFQINVP